MRQSVSKFLVSGIIASLGLMPLQALAQETPADAADRSGGGLEDIVVLARKVAENLQGTPVAVTAFSAAALENRSMQNVSDIALATPSLTIAPAVNSATSTYFSIRGQVLTSIAPNIDPTVGLYLDEIYMPRAIGVDASSLIDLERIEVLKGPQGTLFGKNTTGGAVSLFTKRPVHKFQAQLKGRLGSYGDRAISGVLNVPVGETLAVRVVGERHARDGFGTNSVTGNKFNKRDGYMLRGSLLWEPTSTVSVLLRGDYSHEDATNSVFKPINIVANSAATSEIALESGLANDAAGRAAARLIYLGLTGSKSQDGAMTRDPFDKVKVWGYSATISVDLGKDVTLKSITANRGFDRLSATDFDGSPFDILGFSPIHTIDKQLSQEVQLSGSSWEDRLRWITGLYYSREKISEIGTTIATPLLSTTNPSIGNVRGVYKAYGVFAQGTFSITDQLNLTGGLRWSKDDRFNAILNYNRTSCLSQGATLASLPNLDACVREQDSVAKKMSYTASLDYKPTPDIMVYVKTSRSFRSGGIPTAGGSAASPASAANFFTPFRPEIVTDYEAGLKAEFFDRRLRTNLAVFHTDYKEIQRSDSAVVPGTTQAVSRVTNAAAGRINGVELEVTASPVPGLELSATGTYLDAKYTDYSVETSPGVFVDRSGDRFQWTPKWAYSLSGAYTFPIGSAAEIRTQLDWSWEDEAVATTQTAIRPSFGILNGRIGARFSEFGLDVAIFGRNLTDRIYWSSPLEIPSPGTYTSPLNPPRTFGMEITKNF